MFVSKMTQTDHEVALFIRDQGYVIDLAIKYRVHSMQNSQKDILTYTP